MKNINNLIIKVVLKNRLWIPVLASMIMVLILPLFLALKQLPQAQTIKAIYLKEDSRVFDKFVEGIKAENGVLVLGTSETANQLDGFNYWDILNKDKLVKPRFSVFAGAGISCNTYFPLLLNNKDHVKDLNIFLYINPTYWRGGLNVFRDDYFNRYVGENLLLAVRKESIQRGIYEKFMNPPHMDSLNRVEDSDEENHEIPFNAKIRKAIETVKSYYYYDLNRLLFDKEKLPLKSNDLSSEQIAEFKNEIDSVYNVGSSFLISDMNNSFPAVDINSNFQYEALREFILLCIELDIHLTVYLGPYNAMYCRAKNPELIDQYEKVLSNVRQIVLSAGIPFIDGSDLSNVSGTFNDVQHISRYGAYLTAEQIKKYYETGY